MKSSLQKRVVRGSVTIFLHADFCAAHQLNGWKKLDTRWFRKQIEISGERSRNCKNTCEIQELKYFITASEIYKYINTLSDLLKTS